MTTNILFNWLFGPHIMGLIFLLVGLVQYYFPPKKINNLYGYRMPSAQKNQQTWDEANRYSAIYSIKCGTVVIIVGLCITALINLIPMPFKVKEVLAILSFMIGGMAPPLFMIVATEKHLTKTFGDK